MIYKYKATIAGNKNFAREYEIEDNATLYDLHRHIQDDLDFDEAQLAVFFVANKKWERKRAIPLFDMGEGAMDSVFLADLIANEETYLIYVFDMYHNRELLVEYVCEEDETPRTSYPCTILSKGNAPGQFSKKDEHTDDMDIGGNDDSFDADDIGDLNETTEV